MLTTENDNKKVQRFGTKKYSKNPIFSNFSDNSENMISDSPLLFDLFLLYRFR